jgi:hypothetical protein
MHADTGVAERSDDRSGEAPREDAPPLGTVPLDDSHRTAEFKCTKSARVERFLHADFRDMLKHNYCKVFVWPDKDDPGRILGYYSLSASTVQRSLLSGSIQKKVPGGIPAPVVLLGFMGKTDGVDKGFGRVLIYDAALRAVRIAEHVGVWGMALDAENQGLANWYEKVGFSRVKKPPGTPEEAEDPLFMYARLDRLLGKP